MKKIKIIGAGLAGSEAAWQCAQKGIEVDLYEMKAIKKTAAHSLDSFAELVCSNSLRSNQLSNAVGVLKEEMRRLNSLIIASADETQVPAGSALAVDRNRFSELITEKIKNHPLIHIHDEEITTLDPNEVTIIASGPLTSDPLAKFITDTLKSESLYFYDAAAPIIEKESINFDKAYFKSRYDKGDGQDYINCPMTKEEFDIFYRELISAKTAELKEFEKEIFFEGCMPFEEMARRGDQTLLFGPMKPVGLELEGQKRPYAVVQLRQDNAAASLYNIVGFQTHLTWGEQKRVLRMIPGLENAEIVRYGVMHRNSYLNSPKLLNEYYQLKSNPNWFFVGQMSGVEGYVESAASGLLGALQCVRMLEGKKYIQFPNTCVIGSLAYYISHANPDAFQPMNANFGLVHFDQKSKKKERKEKIAIQALEVIDKLISEI